MKSLPFLAATAAISFAAASLALPANAQGPNGPRPAFEGADANGDGNISAAEFSDVRSARFKQLDVNGDGFLSAADRTGDRPLRGGGRRAAAGGGPLAQLDADGDQKISLAEFTAAGQKQFARADADANAIVTQAELQALRPQQP